MNNYIEDLEKTGRALFPIYLSLLVIAPFPLGSNRPWAWMTLAMVAFGLLVIYFFQYARGKVRVPDVSNELKFITFCLAVWILYQIFLIIPLPVETVRSLSPALIDALSFDNRSIIKTEYVSLSIDKITSLEEVLKSCLYVSIFILTILLVQSKDRLRNLLLAIVVTGVLQAVFGITVVFLDQGAMSGQVVDQLNTVSGTFVNRNHFAGFINMTIAAAIGLIIAVGLREKRKIHRDAHRHHWQSRMLDWRVYMLFYSSLLIFAMIFSESRGGWISFVTMMIIGFIMLSLTRINIKNIVRDYKLALFILLCAIIISAADTFVNRVAALNLDYVLRADIWHSSIKIIKDFWLTGVGSGNFQYIFPLYDSGLSGIHEKSVTHAHNDYLELIIEQGVIGFALLCIAAMLSIKNAISSLRREKSIRKASFAVASLMAICSFLVHSIVDFNFQIPSNAMYFFTFLAVAALQGAQSIETEKRDIAWDDSAFKHSRQSEFASE